MSEATSPRQLVVFDLGDEQYALPIGQVQEIIRYSEPRSVASRVNWVKGVISLRGQIIPVYDLAARLGVASALGSRAKIMILDTGAEIAGVVVDSVDEVLTVAAEQIQPAPGVDSAAIEAIAKVGDRLIVLLNPFAVFTEPQLPAAA
ncbi:MAG TPA: chemotaxis protein CheW [Solirubrobacteraceae bacterium]|jgi:purine-binding chemotaxis protein CheW